MKNLPWNLLSGSVLVIVFTLFLLPGSSVSANRTSAAIVGGYSLPVGWWGERWDPMQSGEINIRYEFSSGAGILIITGLNKAFFTPLNREEVAAESQYHDIYNEFKPYTTIFEASQGGYFKQLPIGFGLYYERLVWRLRTYGSIAMMVYNWKFERSQQFLGEVNPPDPTTPTIPLDDDDWIVEEDGSDLGAQLAIGALYKLTNLIYLDFSAAYHFVNISQKYGSIAYWGQPAQIPPGEATNDLVKDAKGAVNFLQFRIGLRVGN